MSFLEVKTTNPKKMRPPKVRMAASNKQKITLNWDEQRVVFHFLYEASDRPVALPWNQGLQPLALAGHKSFIGKMDIKKIEITLDELVRRNLLIDTKVDFPPSRYSLREGEIENAAEAVFSFWLFCRSWHPLKKVKVWAGVLVGTAITAAIGALVEKLLF